MIGYELKTNGSTKNEISYSYNNLNQLTTLTKSGIITSYEYDNIGRLTNKTNNKGIGTAYTYNKAGLVTQVNNTVNGNRIKTEISSYHLNGLKYLKTIQDSTGYSNLNYGYDDAGRLLYEYMWNGADDICYNEYSYDLRGNRISKDDVLSNESTSYTYDAADHLLQADTTVNNTLTSRKLYTYDDNGNLISEQSRSYSSDGLAGSKASVADGENETKLYSYDRFNRLTGYSCGTTEASYTYNADNLRATKTVNGTTTSYVWDGTNLMYEYGATNGSYAYDMTGILQNGTDTYMKDGHNSVIAKYDNKGNELSSADYDAFGNVIMGAIEDPFGYCGEYLDSESGLIYLRNRYYDSATGRFITEDPEKDGVNWYSYCAGNPVMLVDPWGLLTVTGGTVSISLSGYDIDTKKTQESYKDIKEYEVSGDSLKIYLEEDDTLQIGLLEDFPHINQDVYKANSRTCWAASAAECLVFFGIDGVDLKYIAESYYRDIVPKEEQKGEYYNRGMGSASKVATAIERSGYLNNTNYIAVPQEDGVGGMENVINTIDNKLPFIAYPRSWHIEAAIGYIYAPNAGVNFVICEDSSQLAEDMYPREIFDISRVGPKPVTMFERIGT